MKHNKRNYDVIVVGGGLAGLIAAAVAAESGKKTALLTKGAGTLSISAGVVDLLGYVNGKAVTEPLNAIASLPEGHPYKIIGKDNVAAALDYFQKYTATSSFAYKAMNSRNGYIPTAIGTIKPSYLLPPTSNTELLAKADSIVIVGIKGMKDFYPELMIEGLKKRKSYASKALSVLTLESPYESRRDITALDIARYVDTEKGFDWLLASLSAYKGSTLIVPPVLGTKPSSIIFDKLISAGLQCFETPVMPPSTPGMRLRQLLVDNAKRCGAEVIEMGDVCRADVANGRCTAVYTTAADKERAYIADKFVIATGGFFGGGCIAEPGKAYEAIFGLNLGAPNKQMDWLQPSLLGAEPHIFASMGVRVNAQLKPIDASGAVLLENVHFAGRTLGGYDFAVEKSGNGVALATGYLAGRI